MNPAQSAERPARRSDLASASAIGAIAYLSADVAHHALGHAAACVALGGELRSLSSVFVDCSLTGATIDLAGPAANLAVGVVFAALAVAFGGRSRLSGFFLILAAAFNLYWLLLQVVFSVATDSDDWAWPMHVYGAGSLLRLGAVAVALLGYRLVTRFVGRRLRLADRRDAQRVMRAAWLAAGLVAATTAAFAAHPLDTLLKHALPQSLGLSAGLLFTAAISARCTPTPGAPIPRSWPWMAAAIAAGVLSALILGHGIALAQR